MDLSPEPLRPDRARQIQWDISLRAVGILRAMLPLPFADTPEVLDQRQGQAHGAAATALPSRWSSAWSGSASSGGVSPPEPRRAIVSGNHGYLLWAGTSEHVPW